MYLFYLPLQRLLRQPGGGHRSDRRPSRISGRMGHSHLEWNKQRDRSCLGTVRGAQLDGNYRWRRLSRRLRRRDPKRALVDLPPSQFQPREVRAANSRTWEPVYPHVQHHLFAIELQLFVVAVPGRSCIPRHELAGAGTQRRNGPAPPTRVPELR
jgi:hypothetical protein